ncbi:MAG: family major facilitator superfamily protein [Hyphomicrobiales bacterium]|nr:family major facilitator superfamily protein [Hyphomicrobiales bacterium]
MPFSRRTFVKTLAGAACVPSFGRAARAETYPARPIRLLVGFAAGGSTDTIARLIGQALSERLGQAVVIENRPGAGTNIATEAAVRARPDGYTLLMVGPSATINATLYRQLNFVFLQDAAPIASVVSQPQVMLVHPSLPVKDVAELIAYAKASPGKLTIASAGIGSIGHLSGELFKMQTGTDLLHVPYRGAAPALQDLVSGQVHMSFAGIAGAVEFAKSGMLRTLGVTTRKRSEILPDVPSVSEFVPAYESNDWFGVAAPKDTPADIIQLINREIGAAIVDPKMKARFGDLGGSPLVMSSAEFTQLIRDDTEKWGKVIKTANVTPI